MMASRISRKAPPGSLLKGERKPGKKRKLGEKLIKAAHEAQAIARGKANPKSYRVHRPGYLALVRRCPCLGCDADRDIQAAHLRKAAPGKLITGMGIKPDDLWVLPLCRSCHALQHGRGEAEFWRELGLDPIELALTLSAEQGSIDAMRAVIFAVREKRK